MLNGSGEIGQDNKKTVEMMLTMKMVDKESQRAFYVGV